MNTQPRSTTAATYKLGPCMLDSHPVYIVDDDEAVRLSLRFLLSASGLEAICFESGEEFLDRQEQLAPGVLILDWWMPGCGGAGVLHELREDFFPIVHSAYLDAATTAEARRLGAKQTLEKPCQPAELIEAVCNAATKLPKPAASA